MCIKGLQHISLFIITVFSSLSVFADFSLSAGVQSSTIDVRTNMHVVENDGFNIVGYEDDFDTDISGELALGYQYDFDETYNLALELYGQLVSSQAISPFYAGDNNDYSNDEISTSFDWIAGLRLRPGYYITSNTRFFIDGGVALTRFKAEYPSSLTSSDHRDVTIYPTASSESSTLWGWRYGLGIEHEIDDNFIIGVDYAITQFDEMNASVVGNTLETDPNIATASMAYTPKLSTLGLNFKYMFDDQ
jgi:opacity protein-like surface antigen